MSKIADVLIDIECRLVEGQTPSEIANELEIPLEWIISYDGMLKSMIQQSEYDRATFLDQERD